MDTRKKKFIKRAIVIPIIIAILVTAIIFVIYCIFRSGVINLKDSYEFSSYSSSALLEAEAYTPASQGISKQELPLPSDNMLIGSVKLANSEIELVYNANDVNADKRLNLSAQSSLIGEAGTAFIACNKKDSEPLKQIKEYDSITIDTYYGSYEYTVVRVVTIDSAIELQKCADDLGSAAVIYTDATESYGVSDTYYAIVCEKTSGVQITE